VSPIAPEFSGSDAYAFSDQAAFAQAGVPALLVQEGFDWPGSSRDEAVQRFVEWARSRYHAPGDDLSQPLDFEAARRHLEVITALVVALANADDAPDWYPGSAYALARLRSRAEQR
jgi:hypothetical protein